MSGLHLRGRGKQILLPLLLFFGTLLASGCQPLAHSGSAFVMDTTVQVTAYGFRAAPAVRAALETFRQVERKMSVYLADSEIALINRNAGREEVPVAPETFAVIAASLAIARESDGAFDPTIGPLVRAWGFGGGRRPAIPDAEAVQSALRKVDYRRVVLDRERHTVRLAEPGMILDLGGAAKGYAAGAAAETLRSMGIQQALIDAGGNIVVLGQHPERRPWRVAIRDPRRTGETVATLSLTDRVAVTSGDYERFEIISDQRIHHILNPRTGRPATGLRSVTVIASESLLADLLSTALFVLGKDAGLAFLGRNHPDVDAVFIDQEGALHFTPGFRERYGWEQ